jgi:Arc/MetJ-type ribon-helix-helix transcriptional regulator
MSDDEDSSPPKKKRVRSARNRMLKALRGRGRPPKLGPKRKKKDRRDRPSPGLRAGARFKSVTVPEETHLMIKELTKFYKFTSMSGYMETLIKLAFEQAYEESARLQKIDENRKKAKVNETPDNPPTARRTHF